MQVKDKNPGQGKSQSRSRAVLVALFAIFFIPVFSAMVIAIVAPHWVPFGSINQGELVQPPIANVIQGFTVINIEENSATGTNAGSDTKIGALWSIVHVADSQCADLCEYALTQMRQARLALGKDAHRVQRWWVFSDPPSQAMLAATLAIFPGLRVATIDKTSPLYAESEGSATVQMVDPRGFLMMRYRQLPSAKEKLAQALLKDFKRLLKISKED